MSSYTPTNQRPQAMTGDRPTGPLHLGHYVGSLRSRLELQHTHNLTILVADLQALTDNAGNPQKVSHYIPEVVLDYLAVGLDPAKCRFVLQSAVPELAELTVLLLNLVSVAHLERNPTVRSEITQRGFARDIPAGFMCYPVSQAADIIGLGAGVIPVGEDQLPMIEMANVLVDRINRHGNNDQNKISRCSALLSNTTRLPGVLGGAKMSKSGGNAIELGASAAELQKAVQKMYTDPNHLKITDPGRVRGNVVFSYLDAFDPNKEELEELKRHYQKGGLGDGQVKKRLLSIMEKELAPIRDRRMALKNNQAYAIEILKEGTRQARLEAADTLGKIKAALGVFSL